MIDMALLRVIRRWQIRNGMPILAMERRTGLGWAHAYRLRDCALGVIANALEWQGEALAGSDLDG